MSRRGPTTILLALIVALVAVGVISIFAVRNMGIVGDTARQNSISLGQSAVTESVAALEDSGRRIVQLKTLLVAREVQIFIEQHPDLTDAQLAEKGITAFESGRITFKSGVRVEHVEIVRRSLLQFLHVIGLSPFQKADGGAGADRRTISIMSLIGLIMLMGLVTKNAILLVDYTKVLRRRGLARREALITAGRTRLRPILMTTMAMILGMIPVAAGIGASSNFRQAIGFTIIGGLVSSTVLTLVVVPVVYMILDNFKSKFF
jgi:hypothetical protein